MTGKLEQVFGPRRKRKPYDFTPKETAWPRAPEYLRGILDAFQDEKGFLPNSRHVLKAWEHGARIWYEEHGGDVQLLRRTMRKMTAQGLEIKSPGSCVAVGLTIKHGNKEAEDSVAWAETGEDTEEAAQRRRRKYLRES